VLLPIGNSGGSYTVCPQASTSSLVNIIAMCDVIQSHVTRLIHSTRHLTRSFNVSSAESFMQRVSRRTHSCVTRLLHSVCLSTHAFIRITTCRTTKDRTIHKQRCDGELPTARRHEVASQCEASKRQDTTVCKSLWFVFSFFIIESAIFPKFVFAIVKTNSLFLEITVAKIRVKNSDFYFFKMVKIGTVFRVLLCQYFA